MSETLEQLASTLGEQALEKQHMICTAESCTGGGVAYMITEIAGSSGWFDRGFVTYSNAAKHDMLGVRSETLDTHGAVSECVAREMAEGALVHSQASLSVAITGIAGPGGGTPTKPVGTVWFAWAKEENSTRRCDAQRHQLQGNRQAIREQAISIALRGLLERV